MHLKKKISLFAVSLALVFVLLNIAPQVAYDSGIDGTYPAVSSTETYSLSAAPIPPDLVAYWQMDDGGGSLATDFVTPENDGHLSQPVPWPTGMVGTAIEFGIGAWADCGNNPRLILTDDLTVEAWINIPHYLGQVHTIVENRFQLNPKVFHFGVQDGRLYYDRYNPGQEVLSDRFVNQGEWHHVAAVVSRVQGTVTFYIDGIGGQPKPYNDGVYGGAGFVYLGVENPPPLGPTLWYQGMMDEVAIWSRLLSGAELLDHYQKGLLGLGYLAVLPENTPPVAVDDAYSTNEEAQLSVTAPGVLVNDFDADGDPLEAVLVSTTTHGALTLNPDGSFIYLPDPDYNGLDTFTYKSRDILDESNIATVDLTINPVNDAPIAHDDAYAVEEGVILNIGPVGVLSNDVDIDGDSLTAELVSGPASGTLTLHTDGSLEYYVTEYYGPVTFTYRVFDGNLYSNIATVTIDVAIDTTPPVTQIELSGTMGLNNWYVSDVTVTLTANEQATTAYSINSGPWIPYSGPFVISLEGYFTISFNSTDLRGNRETTQEESYKMDKTPPELGLTTESVPDVGVLVTISATESLSGLADVGYSMDGVYWSRYGDPILLTDEGMVEIYYRAMDFAGNLISLMEIIEVVIEPSVIPTELTYTGDLAGVYSDLAYLEAHLIDTLTGLPLEGKVISFTLGVYSMDAITDSSGIAFVSLILDQPAGTYLLTASFAGDDEYLDSSATCEFVIDKECAVVEYTGRILIPVSDDAFTLMATIFDDDDGYWGDLTKIFVTFTLYLSSEVVYTSGPIMVETTEVPGIGLVTVDVPILAASEYLIVVSFNPDDNSYYCGPDSEATLTIYEPERESFKGSGWIRDADGNRVFFVFHVKYSCRGSLKGFLLLTYRVNEWVYIIRSTEILSLYVEENYAVFEAECRIVKFNLDDYSKLCP
ncbi:MAG: Ig-like domain-containing protein, partial [Candidatus Thorarchaeota archaeon]